MSWLRRPWNTVRTGRALRDIDREPRIGDAFAQNQLRRLLLVFFAVAALSLACVGLYGTLSCVISLRPRASSPPATAHARSTALYSNNMSDIDLTTLSEQQLLDLNRRIVERLKLIRSARQLTQLARFSVGMHVEFDTDDGRTIGGTIARINRQTATIVGPAGQWRVSPSLLRVVTQNEPARVVSMVDRRRAE